MAYTATAILDRVRVRYGDASASFITPTVGLAWLNLGVQEIAQTLMPFKRFVGNSVATGQDSFAVPSDCIMVEDVWQARAIRRVASRVTREEYLQRRAGIDSALSDYPVIWTEIDNRIYVWPRYSGASPTTTASGAVTSTSTTVSVATVSALQSAGRVLVNGEEIEYTTTSTGTLRGCVRGVGGTEAASHASGDTVTQRDLMFLYRRQAASIGTGGETVDVPLYLQPAIDEWMLYLAHKAEGSNEIAGQHYQVFRQKMADYAFAAKREHLSGPGRLRNVK